MQHTEILFSQQKYKNNLNFHLDTDDPAIGKTQVTLLESYFLSTDWTSTIQLTDLHALFYGTDYLFMDAVRNLELTRDNSFSLLDVCLPNID